MKKIISLFVAAVIFCMPLLSVQAAAVTEDNNKSSYQSYAGQGHLTYSEQKLLDFDDINDFHFTWKGTIDTQNKKEGEGSLAVDLSTENPPENFKPNCFETKDGAFKTTITDIRKQTFKFWVYINNIDYLACDHDSVHDTPQKDSGTLYITLAKDSRGENEFFVMHTLEGSGWHLVEFDLNVSRDYEKYYGDVDIEIGYFKIYVEALEGLQMKFDGLSKITYKNDGYKAPELQNNGRWLSTCDFDAIDGAIVSEWYGSSFDTSEKTQGSSSLQIVGRQIHEDYRVVFSGMQVPTNWQKDILHFDFYIEDMEILGTHFEQRMQLIDPHQGCECEAWYYYDYDDLMRYSNNKQGLKEGWNSIDIPMTAMERKQEITEHPVSHSWSAVFNLMYWKGATPDEYYNIKYDNMYIYENDGSAYSNSDVKLDKTPATSLGPAEDEQETDSSVFSNPVTVALIALSVLAVVVIAVIVIIVISRRKKHKTPPA